MKHWLTSSDLAEYLSVQEEQVMAWVARDEIPFHRKFGLLRFFRPEIDDWMRGFERGRQASAPPAEPPRESEEDLDANGPSFLATVSAPMRDTPWQRRAVEDDTRRSPSFLAHREYLSRAEAKLRALRQAKYHSRMGRFGWDFLERRLGPERLERVGRSEALIDGRPVRVQVSKLYHAEGETFRGRDFWWFDIPESYFTEEKTEALLLLGQRGPENRDDFVIFRCPRGRLPREQLDQVEVNNRAARRVHIDASDYRDLRKEVLDFSQFLQDSAFAEGQKG